MQQTKIILVLVLSFIKGSAQNFEKDMELVYKNFADAKQISYNMTYILKASHKSDSRVISETPGKYIKEKDTYLTVLDKIATLVTPTEIVFVDYSEKRINIKKQKNKTAEAPDFMKILKTSFSGIETFSSDKGNSKTKITYKVYLKDNELYPISYYEIVVNTKTNYLERMSLFYKKALQENEDYNVSGKEIPRLDILFTDFNSPKVDAGSELNTAYYYTKSNNKLSPTINFKGYAIKEVF